MPEYTVLHAPIIPVLQTMLRGMALQPGTVALDLGCGAGEKLPLLRTAIGPHATLLALDHDRSAVTAITLESAMPIYADAQAIPLRDGCCTLVTCIAALGLFADPLAALREMRRVLRPGGRALVVTAAQLWVQITDWSPEALAALESVYASVPPIPAHPDIAESACESFFDAGFGECQPQAFLLAPQARHAELALLPWHYLAPHLGPALTPKQWAVCAASPFEIEQHTLTLAIWAT